MLLLEIQLHFMPSRGENTKSNFAKDSASRCSQIWYEPHFISFQLIFVYILENWNHCELAISTLQYKHCLQRFDIWKKFLYLLCKPPIKKRKRPMCLLLCFSVDWGNTQSTASPSPQTGA